MQAVNSQFQPQTPAASHAAFAVREAKKPVARAPNRKLCSNCGANMPLTAKSCGDCRHQFREQHSQESKGMDNMLRKSTFSIVTAAALLIAIVGWFGPSQAIGATSTPSAADYQATITALQTQVVISKATVVVTKTASAKIATTPKAKKSKPYLGGNAFSLLNSGKNRQLSIVATGIYDGTSIPLIVRNNTGKDIVRVQVTGVARSADGKLLASGGDQGFGPNVLHSGDYAIGYVYFSGIDLPADAKYEFETSSTDVVDDSYDSIRDLVVTEADSLDGRIVGFLQNNFKETVKGPMGVKVMCVGADGTLLGMFQGYTDKDSAKSAEKVPFQVDIYGQVDCTNFLVAASGYKF